MYSPEETFVADTSELLHYLYDRSDRNMFECSRALRRLFLDGKRLVDVVKRGRDKPLIFEIVVHPKPPSIKGVALSGSFDSLDTDIRSSLSRKTVKIDEFLRTTALWVGRGDDSSEYEAVSVRGIIDYCANNAGAVHYDPPKEGQEHWNLHRAVTFAGSIGFGPRAEQCFYGITKIALKGLQPLFQAAANRSMVIPTAPGA